MGHATRRRTAGFQNFLMHRQYEMGMKGNPQIPLDPKSQISDPEIVEPIRIEIEEASDEEPQETPPEGGSSDGKG